MKYILGVYIGGSTIVAGRIEGDRIVEQLSAETRAMEGGDVTL